jgi:PPM family protein phosphatase
MPSVHITVACKSDIGRVRSGNEDSFVVTDFRSGSRLEGAPGIVRLDVGPKGVLLLVSDGMGGEKAGEVASALVVQGFTHSMQNAAPGTPSDELLKRAATEAHDGVRLAAQDEARKGMGATLTAVHVIGSHAYIAEVGDSRAYLIRAGAIRQLTKDQSYAQLLVDAGTLKPDEAETSPMSNLLAQAMGHTSAIRPALGKLELHDRDCLLLCSDGLTKAVNDEEILHTVLSSGTLDRACGDLVALANERGGLDNVTVVIAGVGGALPASTLGERLSRSYEILETFAKPVLAPPSTGRSVKPAEVKMTR